MGHKSRVRPGLSSPDHSRNVELTIDKQIDEGQQEWDEMEDSGPRAPQKMDKRHKSNGKRVDVDEEYGTPEMEKQRRRTFR